MGAKSFYWIVFCLCMAFTAVAQQNEREGVRRQRPSISRENWIAQRLMSKEFMERVGIQGEQAQKLKASLEAIEKQSVTLDKEIEQAAAQQAKIAKKVLSEPGAKVDEIMKIIDQIGSYRIQQAKLATQRLVVIRDNLTAEQREKASAILNEEQKKWREERQSRERGVQPSKTAAPKKQ